MVDFRLSDEQIALRDMARKFAKNEIIPVAAKFDESCEFPRDVIQKAYDAGLLNETIPAEFGGTGLGCMESCIITEELAAGCSGISTSIMVNTLGITPIIVAGTKEQKEKFLRPFTEKLKFAAFCLTEPGAGSDVAGMALSVKKDGNNYVLNGTKRFITNGGVADLYTVFGTMDRSKGHKGMIALIVPSDIKGVIRGKVEHKMGQRASNTTEVVFEDAKVPVENILGKEGEGFKVAMMTLDRSRPPIGASSVGVSKAAMEYSIAYAKERKQFGMPIAHFQAIQFMIADMAKEIEASRLLTWQAAWLVDNGMKSSKESSIAKCFAADAAMRITTDAVQIFGGYGYTKEYPVEKLMRDAKLLQIYEGTNQVQRIVIAREVIGK